MTIRIIDYGHVVDNGLGKIQDIDEFKKAIGIDPKNGSAYFNIGRIYYILSYPGDNDYQYDLALDAFANAIVADPLTYYPGIIS